MLGVQSRRLAAESPLLLPCDVGNSVSPEQAQWFRDGVPLSRDDLRGVRNLLYFTIPYMESLKCRHFGTPHDDECPD